jgi:hypothetical protein
VVKLKGPCVGSCADLISFMARSDTGALMRHLDDASNSADGKAVNMYRHLGRTDEERQQNLALFETWLGGEHAWTHKRSGDITKEEGSALSRPSE